MSEDNKIGEGVLKAMAGILKELGLPSFVFFISFLTFLYYGTNEQKQEFIDRFVLFKGANEDLFPFCIVLAVVLILFAGTTYYQRMRIKILKEENERIGKEKSKLQEAILEKGLNSSA